jgi:hypothetical protein
VKTRCREATVGAWRRRWDDLGRPLDTPERNVA